LCRNREALTQRNNRDHRINPKRCDHRACGDEAQRND
jgi:hypothetical protein